MFLLENNQLGSYCYIHVILQNLKNVQQNQKLYKFLNVRNVYTSTFSISEKHGLCIILCIILYQII